MPVLSSDELGKVPFADFLLKIFGVQAVNEAYDSVSGFQGPEFAHRFLERVGVDYDIAGLENLSQLTPGAFITVSNHPYGSIDGIALIDLIGHLRPDFKVMVNKFLSRVKTLEPNFITVSPATNDSKGVDPQSISGVKAALRQLSEGAPLGLFPSGAVSDLKYLRPDLVTSPASGTGSSEQSHVKESRRGFQISDREWQPSVIRIIKKARVPVIPIRFLDRNSLYFYILGLINWKIRTLRLPREVINKAGKMVRIVVGSPISVEEQDNVKDLDAFSSLLRASVYDIPTPEPSDFTKRSALSI